MCRKTEDCEEGLQGKRTYLTCTRRRWAGWRQWQQRPVRCWLQHLSGLLHRHMGAQCTWSKWRLVWKHCIDMSRSGRNKGKLRRGAWGIHISRLSGTCFLSALFDFVLPHSSPFFDHHFSIHRTTEKMAERTWRDHLVYLTSPHQEQPNCFQQNSLPFF